MNSDLAINYVMSADLQIASKGLSWLYFTDTLTFSG